MEKKESVQPRVKAWEVVMGFLLTFTGVLMITEQGFSWKGWPIYPWVAYVYTAAGILIMPAAIIMRRPRQTRPGEDGSPSTGDKTD